MLTVTTVMSRATMTHSSEEMSGKEMKRRGCANLGIMEKTPLFAGTERPRRPLLDARGPKRLVKVQGKRPALD
jgi:hypothetical protein